MSTIQDDIADQILLSKASIAALSVGSILLVPQMFDAFNGMFPSPMTTFLVGRKSSPIRVENDTVKSGGYNLNIPDSIKALNGAPSFRLEMIRLPTAGAILKIGDLLAKSGYFTKTPELEFMRHLRNGIAHGNQFNFVPAEPRRPASFETFVIENGLHGKTVLGDFIESGDVLALFDLLESNLRLGLYTVGH
ncbi:hypothetical protein [Dyadobacter sp. CY347]|uniref:hypothetical protein n=1 Tax=Dyadobacter sp. CY347 TaxID=2909336 RepID=UPI001F23A743|nr:hypothetical protein [Dyadobacter sp. CY347]MCF2487498.1 hypothetical protein [Dyadobacter sp. CY347]